MDSRRVQPVSRPHFIHSSEDSVRSALEDYFFVSFYKFFFCGLLLLNVTFLLNCVALYISDVWDGDVGHLLLVPLAAGGGRNHKVPQKKLHNKSSMGKLCEILQTAQLCLCVRYF